MEIDADDLETLPWNSDADATPALERMLKKAPDGARIRLARPQSYLTLKQTWAPTSRLSVIIAGVGLPFFAPTATTLRLAFSQSGGDGIYMRASWECFLENLAIVAGDVDTVVRFDDNLNKVAGSRSGLRRVAIRAETRRANRRLVDISRVATQNQEWHRFEDCYFSGAGDVPAVGGRYDNSNAARLTKGSDVFTMNGGQLLRPGGAGVPFDRSMIGSELLVAVNARASDGSIIPGYPDSILIPAHGVQWRTTIAEILSPTSVRMADTAPSDETDCYFAVTNACEYGITISASDNSLKHRMHNSSFANLKVAIEAAGGGSFHATECRYFGNRRNITCVGAVEHCADEYSTCESSLQHLYYSGDEGFQLTGPGRFAPSLPMPAAPVIAFGSGSSNFRMEQFTLQDRDLPEGSTIFDLGRAFTPENDATGAPPNVTGLLLQNTYWHTREKLGLYAPLPAMNKSVLRRMMDADDDGLVIDEIITSRGVSLVTTVPAPT